MSAPPILRFTVNDHTFRLLLVEGGVFRMGSDKSVDPEAYIDEGPIHEVSVPSFYLGQFPVTQALWGAVMVDELEPSYFTGTFRPVEQVSWEHVQRFIETLREKTGQLFRLPTEAEWEYAARGGVYNTGCGYAGSRHVKEVAWFGQNSHGETKPVGRKFPNEIGLFDMSGNVEEWCEDQWHGDYMGAPEDGSAWVDEDRGSLRVYRGGGWVNYPRHCRAADRSRWAPDDRSLYLGFRLALSLQAVGSHPAGL